MHIMIPPPVWRFIGLATPRDGFGCIYFCVNDPTCMLTHTLEMYPVDGHEVIFGPGLLLLGGNGSIPVGGLD